MNKRIFISILLALSVAACASKPIKDTSAPVVDKSPSTTQTAPADSGKNNGASTSGVTDTKPGVNPLKDPSNILSKRSIYFDYDKDEVKPEYRALVEAHTKYLQAHPDAKVFLQGNTDERGTREYNLSLGQRRAVAVKKVLNVLGVADKQIETVSFGEEKAKANCNDDACWKDDRRVDIAYENE